MSSSAFTIPSNSYPLVVGADRAGRQGNEDPGLWLSVRDMRWLGVLAALGAGAAGIGYAWAAARELAELRSLLVAAVCALIVIAFSSWLHAWHISHDEHRHARFQARHGAWTRRMEERFAVAVAERREEAYELASLPRRLTVLVDQQQQAYAEQVAAVGEALEALRTSVAGRLTDLEQRVDERDERVDDLARLLRAFTTDDRRVVPLNAGASRPQRPA